MSEYIAKASIEPRDYRVVFLIQQNTAHYRRCKVAYFAIFFCELYKMSAMRSASLR